MAPETDRARRHASQTGEALLHPSSTAEPPGRRQELQKELHAVRDSEMGRRHDNHQVTWDQETRHGQEDTRLLEMLRL